MLALSIRQPYAELILRGVKVSEFRPKRVSDKLIGRRFYIYATKAPGRTEDFASLNMSPGDLPVGVLVGTAVIHKCTGAPGECEWHLSNVKRLKRPLKPKRHPQPS